MSKRVLMVGFHFPPSAISSGHLRFLGFAKYLPMQGWLPVVLSSTSNAYPGINRASLGAIPEGCSVHRAVALDARRHLGLFGKYPGFLARPDRWASWWPGAVYLGLRLIRRYQVSAIWSTYPIMTAHCVAYTLARLTGLPWVADFRDPVPNSVAGKDRSTADSQLHWERRIASRASSLVFTTQAARRSFAARYPDVEAKGHLLDIPNGYEESDFLGLQAGVADPTARPLKFVHSGVLYQRGRSPVPFFRALANLRDTGQLTAADISVILRASGGEAGFQAEIERFRLGEMVTLEPAMPYQQALAEQASADALLLFQGDEFDEQIPAKAYEYLRIGRPIYALVGMQGDTASLLRDCGGATLAPIGDVTAIQSQLVALVRAVRAGSAPRPDSVAVARYSRDKGAAVLAELLDRVVA